MARPPADAALVRIELSGELRIHGSAVLIEREQLGGRRAAVAFARLALEHGRLVPRDALADAVWGDRLPSSWRAALRNVVAGIRSALPEGVELRASGNGYRLDLPSGAVVDVLALEPAADAASEAARGGDYEHALAVATPALRIAARTVLPGEEGEWVEALRRWVADLHGRLELTAGEAALSLGDHARAEWLARSLIASSPLREDGHRLLMHALAEGGNRGAALGAYEQCRRQLDHELGTVPSHETEQLFLRILREGGDDDARVASGGVRPLSRDVDPAEELGDRRRAIRYGLDIARTAAEADEFADVSAIATRTLALLAAAGDPDVHARIDLQVLFGGAQRALGDPLGYATLHAAFADARTLGDATRMADAALAFTDGGAASEEMFVDEMMLPLYEEALAALGDADPARRARLLGHVATGTIWRQGGEAYRRAADEALALARELHDDATAAAVLTTVRRSLAGRLEHERQEPIEGELFALAEALDDPSARVRTILWRFHTHVEEGRGEELETLLEVAGSCAGALRTSNFDHTLAYTRAALTLRGDVDGADAEVERAAEIGRERGVAEPIVAAIRISQLLDVRQEQGPLEDVRDEAIAFLDGAGLPEWLGVIAYVNAETGRMDDVAAGVDTFFDLYRRSGPTMVSPVGVAAFMAVPVARLGDPRRASVVYDLLAPFSGKGAYFASFSGPVDYALALLARTLGRGVDAERHAAVAAAFCKGLGAPRWAQRCRDLLPVALPAR